VTTRVCVQVGGMARLLQGAEHELGEGPHRGRHLVRHLRLHQGLAQEPRARRAVLAAPRPAPRTWPRLGARTLCKLPLRDKVEKINSESCYILQCAGSEQSISNVSRDVSAA
jgi:hypothetical protein